MKKVKTCLLIFFLVIIGNDALAMQNESLDSVYYIKFPDQLTTRLYTSRKYTAFEVKDRLSDRRIRFEPNSTLNMGVGATYNGLTLNLAYGWGFLNPDRGTGDTKYLDLQVHAYPKNFVIDLFGQFYRGYYVDLAEDHSSGMPFYVSPTMRVRKYGANVQYLFNGDKISLRAAFLQNEWQVKSGGSPLLGFEIYRGTAKDDRPIFPIGFLDDPGRNFNQANFFQFGPNAGYVHTFVILKHFFITGYASTNLSLGQQRLVFNEGASNRWGFISNLFLRGFVGYNSEKWSVNFNYVHNRVNMIRNSDFDNTLMTGNYRVNFIYRLSPSPGLKRYLDAVDLKRLL
ncbi:DUF4421 domain-containing protein [Belliella pelovolcani]|uniref:DUF4421 domain-containing protein n=1 Tax=Belliella pelovolcani TaxID=529505 RepID=UPI00391DB227